MTILVTAFQKPPVSSSWVPPADGINGSFQAFTRSPIRLSMAGSIVRAASTAMTVTSTAPSPTLKKTVVGTITMPSSAKTTVMPEKTTALVAVAPARPMASCFSRPRARSSRKRAIMNNE